MPLSIAVLVLVALFASAREASAYIDPGSGSYLLQVLVGGIAAIVVFTGQLWRRMTRPFRRSDGDDGQPPEQ